MKPNLFQSQLTPQHGFHMSRPMGEKPIFLLCHCKRRVGTSHDRLPPRWQEQDALVECHPCHRLSQQMEGIWSRSQSHPLRLCSLTRARLYSAAVTCAPANLFPSRLCEAVPQERAAEEEAGGFRLLRVVDNLQLVAFSKGQVRRRPWLVVVERHERSDASCKETTQTILLQVIIRHFSTAMGRIISFFTQGQAVVQALVFSVVFLLINVWSKPENSV